MTVADFPAFTAPASGAGSEVKARTLSVLEWAEERYQNTIRKEGEVTYRWKIGDVFTDGTCRWRVDVVEGDKAVLRSCSTSWATTIPLTFDEWREGGRWQLEV